MKSVDCQKGNGTECATCRGCGIAGASADDDGDGGALSGTQVNFAKLQIAQCRAQLAGRRVSQGKDGGASQGGSFTAREQPAQSCSLA